MKYVILLSAVLYTIMVLVVAYKVIHASYIAVEHDQHCVITAVPENKGE